MYIRVDVAGTEVPGEVAGVVYDNSSGGHSDYTSNYAEPTLRQEHSIVNFGYVWNLQGVAVDAWAGLGWAFPYMTIEHRDTTPPDTGWDRYLYGMQERATVFQLGGNVSGQLDTTWEWTGGANLLIGSGSETVGEYYDTTGPGGWSQDRQTVDVDWTRFRIQGTFGFRTQRMTWYAGAGLESATAEVVSKYSYADGLGTRSWSRYTYEIERNSGFDVWVGGRQQWQGGGAYAQLGVLGQTLGSFEAGMYVNIP
jgi:hypothetical protein